MDSQLNDIPSNASAIQKLSQRNSISASNVLLVSLPWLNPIIFGPNPSVLNALLCALCLAGIVWSPRTCQNIAVGWLCSSLLSSLIALCQLFGDSDQWGPWVSTSHGIAFANLRQRNLFASLTVIGLAALTYLLRRSSASLRFPSALAFLAMATLMVGNAASASRTGLVATGLLCLLAWQWRSSLNAGAKVTVALALPTYALAAMVLPSLAGLTGPGWNVFSRIATGDEPCSSRLTLWSDVLYLIAQKPWFGWGWGELDYAHFVTLYQGERFCAILDNAHNLPLHLAVELGGPVALAACVVAGWLAVRSRPWAEKDPARQMAWSVIGVIGLHSLLEYPLWYGPFQMAVGLCIALLWRGNPIVADAAAPLQKSANASGMRWFFASLLMALVSYITWDYHRISQIFLPPNQRSEVYRTDTLNKIRGSWLFQSQVQFAELATTALTPDNAPQVHALALKTLHYSPEPLVVQKLIESAVMLGRDDEALFFLQRFQAAFPAEHKVWAAQLKLASPQNSPTSPRASPATSRH